MKPEMTPPDSGVKVRLYNPGFGDCILLAFKDDHCDPRYMLIDCGVHHTYSSDTRGKKKDWMKAVVKDIKKATGGNLHIVAVTHEHTDHISGFNYGKELFEKMTVHDLWLAWTEDPNSVAAKELKEEFVKQSFALKTAFNILKKVGQPYHEGISILPDLGPVLGANDEDESEISFLKRISKNKLLTSDDYLKPGQVKIIDGVEDLRFYVLGPPTDVEWIRKLESKKELYPKITFLDRNTSFSYAILAFDGKLDQDDPLFKQSLPFHEKYGMSKEVAKGEPFFIKNYGFRRNEEHGEEYRRIETDWIKTAEYLALNLNKKTNNTSLVLALELTKTEPKKVLLFVGDAQLGNWLSWYTHTWTVDNSEEIKAEELLKRTVLYKVGHHGSHNATLKRKGLELMISKDLVSMIPVDEEWAYKPPVWKHPAKKLLKAIIKNSRGRVLRTDKIPKGDIAPTKPDEATEEEWVEFLDNLDWDKKNGLWIEYTIN